MTKLLVLSDSHGVTGTMRSAVERQQPDYIVHLGDYERDAKWLTAVFPDLPLISLPGNCDRPIPNVIQTKLLDFEGVKIFMTHGHLYDVKHGLLKLELAGREAGANIVLFGHTHQQLCVEKDGLWLLNPGSCGEWFPSCGLVSLQNGSAQCSLLDLSN